MNIDTKISLVAKVAPDLLDERDLERSKRSDFDYNHTIVNAEKLPKKTLEAIKAESYIRMKWKGDARDPAYTTSYNDVCRVLRFTAQEGFDVELSTLEELEVALKKLLKATSPERHWLYRDSGDGIFTPILIHDVTLVKRGYRNDDPAHVTMEGVYMYRGEMKFDVMSFYKDDISPDLVVDEDAAFTIDTGDEGDEDEDESKPKKQRAKRVKRTLLQIIQRKKLYIETAQAFEEYQASQDVYVTYQGRQGLVVTGVGRANYLHRSRSQWRDDDDYVSRMSTLEVDGVPADLVLDDKNPEKVKPSWGWSWKASKLTAISEALYDKGQGKVRTVVPVHPYVMVYDLRKHVHALVNVRCLTEHEFDEGIKDKLVLPDRDKKFIDLLLNSADLQMDDIVRGKQGGVFILSTGEPGTGKTLTAEVYSEVMKRPLYTVHCSQLGVDPEKIEDRLKKILARATRWKAVLLLDEADVYIRKRGTDVNHNAIVGVFLRVLEYYNGILFMTSNMSDLDDAIESRALAHIVYRKAHGELLREIWKVLSTQFKVNLSDADIDELTLWKQELAGRDVKNLLRLAKFWCTGQKKAPSAEVIKLVSSYQKPTE